MFWYVFEKSKFVKPLNCRCFAIKWAFPLDLGKNWQQPMNDGWRLEVERGNAIWRNREPLEAKIESRVKGNRAEFDNWPLFSLSWKIDFP
jgi:hypothetical protein